VLSSLTSSSRYGQLDASALLQATAKSVVGRWWAEHRGLLVSSIVQLDAHASAVPPSLSVAVLRRYGPSDVVTALADLGVASKSPADVADSDVADYFARSDLGRHLVGEERSVGETRGNPAESARAAFAPVASELGFDNARDKALNRAFAEAIAAFLNPTGREPAAPPVACETKPGFAPLVPDNFIEHADSVHCIGYTWRQSEFMVPKNRATTAEYILKRLQGYVREMGWVEPGR